MKLYSEMKTTEANDSAYGIPDALNSYGIIVKEGEKGLTKREYFAAMAMQALYQAVHANQEIHVAAQQDQKNGEDMEQYVARFAVKAADALITKLNKQNP